MNERRDVGMKAASFLLALLIHLPLFGVFDSYFERTRAGAEAALEVSWHCPCK